jgi:short-subunit dehydrogenase
VTKCGVVSLSETLHFELRQRKAPIGVTVLCPSFVRSRLNEAERNRPAELQNTPGEKPPTPEEQAFDRLFEEKNKKGMTPEQFAELVFQAIEQNTFYIFTDPQGKAAIKQRMEDILQGRNPTLPQIP